MSRIRPPVATVAAMLILSMTAAASAQAFEGPFFKVGGIRTFKEASVEGTITGGNAVLNAPSAGITLTCKALQGLLYKIKESAKGNAGTATAEGAYRECEVTGNGANCKVKGGEIKLEPLKSELAFSNAVPATGQNVLALVAPQKGTVLAKILMEGSECKFKESALEGSAVAQVQNEKGEPITLGAEVEATTFIGAFPEKEIKEACVETSGKITCKKTSLKVVGVAANAHGAATVKIAGKEPPKWGAFTA